MTDSAGFGFGMAETKDGFQHGVRCEALLHLHAQFVYPMRAYLLASFSMVLGHVAAVFNRASGNVVGRDRVKATQVFFLSSSVTKW